MNPGTGQINYQIIPSDDKNRLFRSLLFNENVTDAISSLLGTKDIYRWLDQIFLKPALHGSGTEWHQDNAYFKVEDPYKGIGVDCDK